jgi:hypothetical protein
MSKFTNHLRERIGQATTKLNRKKTRKIANGDSNNCDCQTDNHRHGDEGHVLQVNDQPEQAEDKADDAPQ